VTQPKPTDAPGFFGYLGGGRFTRDRPPINSPQRAMLEFMPYDEGCPPGCPKCKPNRRRRSRGGGR
jgi:hypothetical protein